MWRNARFAKYGGGTQHFIIEHGTTHSEPPYIMDALLLRHKLPLCQNQHLHTNCKIIVSRPGQSQGLLYKHLCHSLFH